MAYLRWSWSPWYAYSHVDGGDGDAALLVAWHDRGVHIAVTAGELSGAGCEGRPERLLVLMENLPEMNSEALRDAGLLAPAVDEFLFEIYNAGKIPMPLDVVRRFRTLRRLVQRAMKQPGGAGAVDSFGYPLWVGWTAQIGAINRQYPPPRVPQEIRDLMQTRALRELAGEYVSPEEDSAERRRIAAAYDAWPPVRSSADSA